MKEPQCPAQDVNAAESASSTTSTSQESGQNEPSGVPSFDQIEAQIEQTNWMLATPEHRTQILIQRQLTRLIELQEESNNTARETNYLLAALIEAMGQDPDPEELHIPRPL